MRRLPLFGGVLTVGGLVGYAVGTAVAYPGRAFSVTAIMVGLTTIAISASGSKEGTA